ncbi:MAG: histidine--tRNA ligase [Clostridia bacterium]|nr:histidine--tRNA ligase [Clostridia bacterium]MBO7177489.1 histidine--tRNA ligase [Clostridia bacterium]
MINIPKGTKDLLPYESYKWHYVENIVRDVTSKFGFLEIRTPTFEHTELFLRGVGETTDIVNKEMYTFIDKGNRSITLKPEGTAGVARSYVENGLSENPQPMKMYYITPVFRYERPQAGRLREHHQFGVELYGSDSPYADVEVISVAKTLFNTLGVKELELNINSIGCPVCRAEYNKALKEYLAEHIDGMCATCKERLDKNPLRILDCKEERCKAVNINAPKVLDFLCDDCKKHHEDVKSILNSLGIEYKVNPNIVRGLDYYTKTVFEFVSTSIGAQGTVCGGGRYNNLVKEVGGKPTPAVGFGMGIERLVMVLEALGLSVGEPEIPSVYIAPLSQEQMQYAYGLAIKLRSQNVSADTDLMGRSLKAQMKYAGKRGYAYVVVLGENEINEGVAKIKIMATGEEIEVSINNIAEEILRR